MSAYSTSRRAACDLSYHRVGQRVRWMAYDKTAPASERWLYLTGVVIAHGEAGIKARTDDGEVKRVLCANAGRP